MVREIGKIGVKNGEKWGIVGDIQNVQNIHKNLNENLLKMNCINLYLRKKNKLIFFLQYKSKSIQFHKINYKYV